jgi:putative SOS response-associated peptidase YedK
VKGSGTSDIAGIRDEWYGEGKSVSSAALITTDANVLPASLPNKRMPVILPPGRFDEWLEPRTPAKRAKDMLRPIPAGLMTCEAAPRSSAA